MSRSPSGANSSRPWEYARQQAFRKYGRRCDQCGKAGRFEVHHRIPVSQGGTNDVENLQVLCRGCHIEIHRPKRGAREQDWDAMVGELRVV